MPKPPRPSQGSLPRGFPIALEGAEGVLALGFGTSSSHGRTSSISEAFRPISRFLRRSGGGFGRGFGRGFGTSQTRKTPQSAWIVTVLAVLARDSRDREQRGETCQRPMSGRLASGPSWGSHLRDVRTAGHR